MNKHVIFAALLLAGCHAASDTTSDTTGDTTTETTGDTTGGATTAPGDTEDTAPYAGIAADEVIRFTGTEPFWGGQVAGSTLTYSTPENIDGATISVERFAGRGGLSFSGELDGQRFDLAITPGECSDGMSDRTYPFVATLQLGSEQRNGCAWREGDDLGPPP